MSYEYIYKNKEISSRKTRKCSTKNKKIISKWESAIKVMSDHG